MSRFDLLEEAWFRRSGWVSFPFQRDTWQACLDGKSGLLHAPTGMGKTLAVWGGPVLQWLESREGENQKAAPPIQVLWITPLRALARDSQESLQHACISLNVPWQVELRTGDTSSSVRQRQKKRLPTCLITTPESLSLLLSYPEAQSRFRTLRTVVVDEWHELLGSRRGVMTELCLARLRAWNPELRTWGLSATLGNLDEALQVLLGPHDDGLLVGGAMPRDIQVDTLIPQSMERFPWGGHLGIRLVPQVVEEIARANSTLLFTNTRSQTELWYQALLNARPDWSGLLAIHHGSIERDSRNWVEEQLRQGRLKCVVCTSSLDLGVDFSPVDQVLQVGSPKGVARFIQRAGRSGHSPGRISRIVGVPTHAFELVEFAAVREAIRTQDIEPRPPLIKPLDVLAQHLVTVALGGGFDEADMRKEVQKTYAFSTLTDREWKWVLGFVMHGGKSLKAYPQYARVTQKEGQYVVASRQIGRMHRLSIGVIASDSMMSVRYANGGRIGSVEESFIARLRPGDVFHFSGKSLELIQVRDMQAVVRKSRKQSRIVPRWMGGSMPLSSQLARGVTRQLAYAQAGEYTSPELQAVKPLMDIQHEWSLLPNDEQLLIEQTSSREGHQVFLFPFAGRLVHEGLAALVAYRITREEKRTLSMMMTDYGFELLSPTTMRYTEEDWRRFLSPDGIDEDIMACINATELAKRQFRAVARVAGLVFTGYPGQNKTARQLQISSGLLFDVFERYDPDNLLLDQARREVMESQLEYDRLRRLLSRIASQSIEIRNPKRLTPLSFPLWAERIRSQVSTESFQDRVASMSLKLEKAAHG